jgi:hypothetical protein
MTLFAIAFIVASPFVYWLLRRRTRDRANSQPAERSLSPDIIADESGTATIEVEHGGGGSSPGELGVDAAEDATRAAEIAEVDAVAVNTEPEIPNEPDKATYPEVESQVPGNDNRESVASAIAEPAGQLLSAEIGRNTSILLIKPSQEEGYASAVLELPDLTGRVLDEEVAGNVVVVPTVTDQEPQADRPMAESIEVLAPFDTGEPRRPTSESGNAGPSEPAERARNGGAEKTLPRYRPPVQKPPRPAPTRSVDQTTAHASSPEVTLEIRVRLALDRFYFCNVTFLPGRTAELNDDVVVKLGPASLQLVAQEDWYQDLSFPEAGRYLRDGFELKGVLSDQRRSRWLLKGRDVYVLAFHPRANGFVSATRLLLGRSHVVLCVNNLVGEVETVLKEAGCQGYSKLDETHGLPDGWAGFRGVSPTNAIAVETGISDPFYAIKPASDIEIEFEAGVRLRNSVWLEGYPPKIKLFGQPGAGIKALIDGKEALPAEDGSLVVDGYGLPGSHSVYSGGMSRSYSVEEPPDSWEAWPAYQFGEAQICGALVQLPPEEAGRTAFTVPMSNPLLIGAEPGQVFRCSARSVAVWKGFVPFDVVWALPAQPLTCNKKTARILQFADKPLMPRRAGTRPLVWCIAILDASRKGLRIEGGSAESAERWSEYKKTARSIWRGRR